ncbi:MAG TPA: PepSY domain-containing protein [Steroidobacteraceae bacterium]
MKLPRLIALLLPLLVLGAEAPAAFAQARDGDRRIVVADGRVSLDQAVKMAERRFKARVVRAETKREGENTVYVLRLLNDEGRVWTVRVDAQSGAIR